MYHYWFSGDREIGRNVIMFSFDEESITDPTLSKWFHELGPVTKRIVYKAGSPAGRFYYRVGYNFRH
jgi:dolichol-phosphate mannosyltransferase